MVAGAAVGPMASTRVQQDVHGNAETAATTLPESGDEGETQTTNVQVIIQRLEARIRELEDKITQ